MAEPISFAITVATLPIILGAIQNTLQLALDAMPEIHDARNKHAVKKLIASIEKAKDGPLTDKDYQQFKHYYNKAQAVALLSQNQELLSYLDKGLLVMDKKRELQSLDTDISKSETQSFKILGMQTKIVETCEKLDLPDYESAMNMPAPLEGQIIRTTENKVKSKAWEKPAMWCIVAVMPPLLFVPKIRQKC
ncbi:hypothetical protein MMC28_008797 [Mycoblastus sanguinarius]|nr:hypothetical protein [Mycoblastus sanguinarius]